MRSLLSLLNLRTYFYNPDRFAREDARADQLPTFFWICNPDSHIKTIEKDTSIRVFF